MRALVESGMLAGERGSYRLVWLFESTQVPATVQAVLAARIDRLAPEDKRLLQAASVIGKDVPYQLLQAIAELSEEALRQGLTRLQAAEFLYETSLFPDLEYTFKHALTHEVAYGSLLQERRRSIHATIVGAVEALYPNRRIEQVEWLAHHALRGELWEQAVAYLHQAARKAVGHSAHREALDYYEEALAVLQRLPQTPATREHAIDLYLEMHAARIPLGQHGQQQSLAQLQEAEALAIALDDQRRLGQVSVQMAQHYWQSGDYHRAVAAGQRGLAIGGTIGDPMLRAVASFHEGQATYSLGNYGRAGELFVQGASLLAMDVVWDRPGFTAGFQGAGSRAWWVACLAEQGEFAAAMAGADEALRIAEAVEHPFTLTVVLWALGRLHLLRGDWEQAITLEERGLELCRAWDIGVLFSATAATLGAAYAQCGRVDEAVPLLEEAVAGAARGRFHARALSLIALGGAYLSAGRREEAGACASRALGLAQDYHERGNEAWALRSLGKIAAHADAPEMEQAEVHYREALALAEELGMRPLVAHCHLGLGTLYQRMSRGEQAHAELTTAAEMYRVMETTFWLARAEAARTQGDS